MEMTSRPSSVVESNIKGGKKKRILSGETQNNHHDTCNKKQTMLLTCQKKTKTKTKTRNKKQETKNKKTKNEKKYHMSLKSSRTCNGPWV